MVIYISLCKNNYGKEVYSSIDSLSFLGILIVFIVIYLILYLNESNHLYAQDFNMFNNAFWSLFENKTNTLLTLTYMLIAGIRANGFLLIIYNDSPITENLLSQMVHVYNWIYASIVNGVNGYFILSLISSLVLLFGLVVNLIAVNYCDLQKNTKEEIIKRSNEEKELTLALLEYNEFILN